ncbi:hypothetical protein H6F47_17890 [Sphaerospermopsis sp. FACHB-1094]|nr:hypothetical protein [Sphaerospermopsis sp. FACHB-1094]
MVIWGFEIGDRYLNFRPFCIKIILKGLQKSEITDCDTGGCGMWVVISLYFFETVIHHLELKI